mmetsp:Transcript_16937/g.42428  ORF Transcript_16937/g.42428 Transcript_16937/m.42428 type:complete len:210 (-) Transcript_16937:537-1166(-)
MGACSPPQPGCPRHVRIQGHAPGCRRYCTAAAAGGHGRVLLHAAAGRYERGRRGRAAGRSLLQRARWRWHGSHGPRTRQHLPAPAAAAAGTRGRRGRCRCGCCRCRRRPPARAPAQPHWTPQGFFRPLPRACRPGLRHPPGHRPHRLLQPRGGDGGGGPRRRLCAPGAPRVAARPAALWQQRGAGRPGARCFHVHLCRRSQQHGCAQPH